MSLCTTIDHRIECAPMWCQKIVEVEMAAEDCQDFERMVDVKMVGVR